MDLLATGVAKVQTSPAAPLGKRDMSLGRYRISTEFAAAARECDFPRRWRPERKERAMTLAPNAAMSEAYWRIDQRLKAGDVVILDGGIGSELQEVGYPERKDDRPKNFTWGSLAIHEAPEKLIEVHRRYAAAGADVLETHTFALNRVWAALQDGRLALPKDAWKQMALDSVILVREGAARAGRDD
ncbi:MAG: hypothetical protein C4346_04810, partial [Chloroflexota bacterium]